FCVPLSLEVGRIIRGSESASTFNFKKLKYLGRAASEAPGARRTLCSAYEIERRAGGARSTRR
ncbi:hypothetical protein, partial [Pseudomonas sp. VA159-2]|uniref:hypothetical protein n=1 Tax=Pseudomonas sp. VA159-2 TaxID=2956728 RepID=UPI002098381E